MCLSQMHYRLTVANRIVGTFSTAPMDSFRVLVKVIILNTEVKRLRHFSEDWRKTIFLVLLQIIKKMIIEKKRGKGKKNRKGSEKEKEVEKEKRVMEEEKRKRK